MRSSRACALLLLLALSFPTLSSAQFDPRKPDAVGVIVMPLIADREEDDSVAFLLEDFLGARLGRRLRRPVHLSREISPALQGTPASCLRDPDCVRLLGGQFNSSLVADGLVLRRGSELELRVDWYTTGNGLKVGRESVTFAPGGEDAVVDAFEAWVGKLFDPSLRVTPSAAAEEGAALSREEQERVEEYKAGREKKVSSRRSDFGEGPAEDRDFDRADPTADLRGAVEVDEEPEPPPRTAKRDAPIVTEDSDHDELEAPPPRERATERSTASPRSTEEEDSEEDLDEPAPKRRVRDEDEPEDLDLDSPRDTDTVSTYMDAQQAGLGTREYARYEKTGLSMESYLARRWAFGKRFHVRISAFYGLGGLTRRYASTIFVRAGNVKTDEYLWESLGMSWVNPGVQFGLGFAPIDLLEISLDVGAMYGKQDLRREYDSHDVGSNIPAAPESAATAHVVADLKARFFVLPKRRVKITASLGPSLLFLAGYSITGTAPLDYASRPPATIVGLTVGAGTAISLSPYFALSLDLSGTVYLTQGAAKFEQHELFNGVTEPYLPPEKKQAPLPSTPAMGRFTIAPMILF